MPMMLKQPRRLWPARLEVWVSKSRSDTKCHPALDAGSIQNSFSHITFAYGSLASLLANRETACAKMICSTNFYFPRIIKIPYGFHRRVFYKVGAVCEFK